MIVIWIIKVAISKIEETKEKKFKQEISLERQKLEQEKEERRQHIRASIFNEPNSVQPIQTELLNLKKDEHCYVKAERAEWIIGFGDSFKIEDIGTLYVTNSRIILMGKIKIILTL